MSKINNSCFVPALIGSAVIGFFLSLFNLWGMNDNIWIPVAIVAILGCVTLFLGKIIEMRWMEVGAIIGSTIGLVIGYFCA